MFRWAASNTPIFDCKSTPEPPLCPPAQRARRRRTLAHRCHRPHTTSIPRNTARAPASSASRVLPMPGSPLNKSSRPCPLRAASIAARISPSSRSRPMKRSPGSGGPRSAGLSTLNGVERCSLPANGFPRLRSLRCQNSLAGLIRYSSISALARAMASRDFTVCTAIFMSRPIRNLFLLACS